MFTVFLYTYWRTKNDRKKFRFVCTLRVFVKNSQLSFALMVFANELLIKTFFKVGRGRLASRAVTRVISWYASNNFLEGQRHSSNLYDSLFWVEELGAGCLVPRRRSTGWLRRENRDHRGWWFPTGSGPQRQANRARHSHNAKRAMHDQGGGRLGTT